MARGGGRRTYVRDSAGRFASTPGSAAKKAAKSQSGRTSTLQARSSLKRSRAKLAAKDKADETLQGTLGRRAQKGAVTRGSKKLAGVKVASQARISGGRRGVIGKPKGLKPGAPKKTTGTFRPGQFKRLKTIQGVSYEKPVKKQAKAGANFRPGEFYRGNFRPQNITSKPQRVKNPFESGSGPLSAERNARIAKDIVSRRGIPVRISSGSGRSGVMGTATITPNGQSRISFNKSEPGWADVHQAAIKMRKKGYWSSSSPLHVVNHEIGHTKDKRFRDRLIGGKKESWTLASSAKNSETRIKQSSQAMNLARRRVSETASQSPSEFVAETYAARRAGKKYDHQVMNAYRDVMGLPPLRLKGQKPIRRKPKPKPKP